MGDSKTAAAVLAILLGGIGAHKFYLGKHGQGVLYLVFFWTFIPGIIALVEGIWYLTMDDDEFVEKILDEDPRARINSLTALDKLSDLKDEGAIDELEWESLSTKLQSKNEVPLDPVQEIRRAWKLRQKDAMSEEQFEMRKTRALEELR